MATGKRGARMQMIPSPRLVGNDEPAIFPLPMSRLFTRESVGLIVLGSVVVVVVGLLYHLAPGILAFALLAWWMVAVVLSVGLIRQLIPLYLRLGLDDRALELAIFARDGAPNRKLRDIASVDVAMVQASAGRFADALRNLEGVNAFAMAKVPRALVEANRAWCRAHLGRDLDKALEEARGAREAVPEEGVLAYIEGLVLHRLGRDPEALEAIEASLKTEPDPRLPQPGERALVLYEVRQALGDDAGARAALDDAVRHGGRGPFHEAIARAAAA